MVTEGFRYLPEKIAPGAYGKPFHVLDNGLPPQPYKESPMSAALARQGKILSLEQRIPKWDSVYILPPGDEIGVYGGTIRTTQQSSVTLTDTGLQYGLGMSPDGMLLVPRIFKTFESNGDGTKFTFQIRAGARWHDGYPHTMEDVRFALEDLILNKELMPSLPPVLKSPITGNDMRVTFVDDETFEVSFDDPNFSFQESTAMNIFSGIKGCPRCFISPSHVQKRYHVKYNEQEIPALLDKFNQSNWVRLFTTIRNVRGFEGQYSEDIPTEFDRDYIYRGEHYIPWMGGFWAKNQEPGGETTLFERNHYHPSVDPEGNQLPYADAYLGVRTETRETGVFRSMNGESDFLRRDLITAEMPLYLANAEKGDYSVLKFDSPDGSDATVIVNQEFVQDPEVGSLLRTKDFRIALSLAWNRNGVNQFLAAGLGTPQNMAPHPSTPYFPGERWRVMDVEYDLDLAKALMAELGYGDRDGDGYLDRKTDGEPLTLFFQATGIHYEFVKWLSADWKALGIKLEIREGSSRQGTTSIPPTEYFEIFASTEGGTNPWSNGWNRVAPTTKDAQGPAIGQFYATRGREGMGVTGADPQYKDSYGNMSPQHTYPADITGDMFRLQELIDKGWTVSMLSPERIELGKELFRVNADEKYKIGGLAYAGLFRALALKRNNMRNVPKNWSPASTHPIEWFYFEDGIDNVSHAGNRSARYKSVNFLDPEYWD
jgi:peptide/nickel transport system substrate-binding protein